MPKWSTGIASVTLAGQVADRILQLIADGSLRTGQALPPQRQLAREMGVSLSAIREAIQRLQMLRVIRTRHGSGAVVEGIGWQHLVFEPALRLATLESNLLRHLSEARHALEVEVVSLAVTRASQEDIDALLAVVEEARKAIKRGILDFEMQRRLNSEFHLGLARSTKNPVLSDLMGSLVNMNFGGFRRVFEKSGAIRSWHIHRRIIDAIAERNLSAAVAAIAEHGASLTDDIDKIEEMIRQENRINSSGYNTRRSKDVPKTPEGKRILPSPKSRAIPSRLKDVVTA